MTLSNITFTCDLSGCWVAQWFRRSECKQGAEFEGKVLAPILLDKVRQKLLTRPRHNQSGFIRKKYTVDRILALHDLTERLRAFRC